MTLEPATIVAAALRLLDETGLDGITMRKLADALGVQAPSLYWHFPGKPALLDAMAAALLVGIGKRIAPSNDHAELIRNAADTLRRALLSRRDGARVYFGSVIVGEPVLELADLLLNSLTSAGFDPEVSVRFSATILHFVPGFVIQEQAWQTRAPGSDLTPRLDQAAAASFPNATAMLTPGLQTEQDARFAFGVDLLIRGLGEPTSRQRLPNKGVGSFLDLLQRSADAKP